MVEVSPVATIEMKAQPGSLVVLHVYDVSPILTDMSAT